MRLNKLDLNLIVCLDALLAEQSVSRAAERVFVSQPAMSIALKRLRLYFEDDIVVQVGRRMQLTPFSESIRKSVRDSILQMQAISEWKPNFDPLTSERRITIQASDYVASVYMVSVFEFAYRLAPRMSFQLRLMGTSYLEDLDSGKVDLLIVPEVISSRDHPREPLFSDTFSCVVWNQNSLAARGVSREKYLQMGHVITEWDGGKLASLDETLMAQVGLARRREITAPSFSLTPQFVVGTDRIATVQTRLAQKMALQWPLRVLASPFEIPPIVEVVQWHKYQERDPAILWFLHVLRSAARDMPKPAKPQSMRKVDTKRKMHRLRRP
jgi:LysR family transcriptional regulator, nod-box dependent transcriptional activator